MALTRKYLKTMGLSEEQIDSIIEAHGETVDGLKAERDKYKAEADKLTDMQKQLDSANERLANAGDAAKVQADFDAYKKAIEAEKLDRLKGSALDGVLTEIGIKRDSFRNAVKKAYDLSKLELDKDGSIKGKDSIAEALKNEYSDFIGEVSKEGVQGATPPTGDSAGMTKDKIMAIKDATARQKAIAENIELFN